MRKIILILGVLAILIWLSEFVVSQESAHVVLSNDLKFVFMENDGSGKFAAKFTKGTSVPLPHEITAGDFDLDGIWDVAVNHHQEGKFTIFWGSKTEGKRDFREQVFEIPFAPEGEMHAIGKGDFDEDGDVDLALVDNVGGFGGIIPSNVVIALSDGKGEFSDMKKYDIGINKNIRSIKVDDFNGDKHLDFIVPEALGESYYVFLNNKNNVVGEFDVQERSGGLRLHFIESGDIDGDGDEDIALADAQYIRFGRNNGLGAFSSDEKICVLDSQNICINEDFNSVELADYNNDGFLDVAGLRRDRIYLWLGDGRGKFELTSKAKVSAPKVIDIESVDVNGDGIKDIIAGYDDAGKSGIFVFRNGFSFVRGDADDSGVLDL